MPLCSMTIRAAMGWSFGAEVVPGIVGGFDDLVPDIVGGLDLIAPLAERAALGVGDELALLHHGEIRSVSTS